MRLRKISTAARLDVHNAVLVPTLLYDSEMCVLQAENERKINAAEMRSLRRIRGVSLADRIRIKEIHRITGTSEHVVVKMKKNVLSWFGQVERISHKTIEKIYVGKLGGKRSKGRSRLTCHNTVSKILEEGHVKT